uniref:hypothetical protein n=1 Tax=Alistipes sp. TaxID=1872444 RepID=UPI004056A231
EEYPLIVDSCFPFFFFLLLSYKKWCNYEKNNNYLFFLTIFVYLCTEKMVFGVTKSFPRFFRGVILGF